MRTLAAAWAQIAARPSRIVATVLAILLGTGFAGAALVFTATFQADLTARVGAQYSRADVVVIPQTDTPATELASRIASVRGVAAAEPLYRAGVPYTAADSHGSLSLTTFPTQSRLRWAGLADGAWPSGPHELVVDRDTATAANLPLGTRLTLSGPDGTTLSATVVGIADVSSSPLAGGRQTAFAVPGAFADLGFHYAPMIAVLAGPGVDADALAAAVGTELGDQATTRTAQAQAEYDLQDLTGQTTALTTVLLGFAAIALVVAGIVIANTFTILLTQRRRQIALLRCVGATGSQVRREVIVEASLIGGIGSLLGVGVGIGAGAIAAAVTGLDTGGLTVPVLPLVIVTVVGILLTVGAAVLPASRAMRVPPLVALRPVAEPVAARRTIRARVVTGVVLVLLGGLVLAGGVLGSSLLMALPGGAISAVGVLLLTRSFLPPLLRLAGRAGPAAGVPGRLAAANAVRNPGRAAATSAALVVGVGLIVMLQVAAASVGASVDRAMADRYPVDVSVAGDGTPLPASVVTGVRGTEGLAGTISVPGAHAAVSLPGAGVGQLPGGDGVTLLGAPADAAAVLRGGLEALDQPATGAAPPILVPAWWLDGGAVQVGDRITLTVAGHSQQFTVHAGRLPEAGTTGISLVTTGAALGALAPSAPTVVIWAALADTDDAAGVTSALNSLVAGHPDIYVQGSASERAAVQSVLGTVTTVATGLLAVAVVIAIVGIGNTIGLSVVERTRESALLRALGLRRGQLRTTLALEALLLALIGAVVGIVLGLIYGWAGAAATFNEIGRVLVFSVPWGSVGLVLLVAVAAGVLASALPARRAARATPVEGLAEE
jgi:putative ABC transport system permease protein